jgi:biopolymer transport protein TolR
MATLKHTRRRPMSEINVVPYIDVMLVLLVIFMITAPLLTPGVLVELPQGEAEPLPGENDEPLVVIVTKSGDYYLSVGDDPDKPISHQVLVTKVSAVLRHRPGTPVYVRGDTEVEYGKVVTAMVLLQKAGVPGVGLITQSPN